MAQKQTQTWTEAGEKPCGRLSLRQGGQSSPGRSTWLAGGGGSFLSSTRRFAILLAFFKDLFKRNKDWKTEVEQKASAFSNPLRRFKEGFTKKVWRALICKAKGPFANDNGIFH